MTVRPHSELGAILIGATDDAGSMQALADEAGISRQALARAIQLPPYGDMLLSTFVKIWRTRCFMTMTFDDVIEAMETRDDGEPWEPDHAIGGRARQGSLCAECGQRLSRDAANARWLKEREKENEMQMAIAETEL